MPFEVELKARLTNPPEIEAKAKQLGTLKKETLKEDVYFRAKNDTDIVPTDRYRLRREDGQATVTFKQTKPAWGIEVNDETEFVVDEAHAFFKFTHRFGFEPFVVKRKQSRVYQIGRASVEFNQVEHIGHFIEIEIICTAESELLPARTEIAQLLNKLGLETDSLEPRPYIQMIQDAYPARFRFIDDPALDWPFAEILA